MKELLHNLCKIKDLEKAIKIINQGVDLNKMKHGKTAIAWASYYNNLELIKILINNGVDINLGGKNDDKAVIMAEEKGNVNVVKLLVENGADIAFKEYRELKNKSNFIEAITNKNTNLDYVKKELNNNILEKFLADEAYRLYDKIYYPTKSAVLVRKRYQRNMDLITAIINNDFEIVKKIVSRKNVDFKFINLQDKNGIPRNALSYATLNFNNNFKPNAQIIKLLVEKGNYSSDDLGQSLIDIIGYEDMDIIKILVDNGADVNYFDNGELTPLSMAIEYENQQIVSYLLKNGADPYMRYLYAGKDSRSFNAYERSLYKDINLNSLI